MAHLIDSNCFIDAANRFYGFDFCPGFWDWIDQQHALGVIYSIEAVGNELKQKNDDLAKWAKQKDARFFLPPDNFTATHMTQLVTWLDNERRTGTYDQRRVSDFLSVADPLLIAHAWAYNHTVVTHETLNLSQRNKVKIPNVCHHIGVPYITIFDLLKQTGAQLKL